MNTITVLGGGSWATALVKILSDNKASLKWWIRDPEVVEYLKKHKRNPSYLSSIEFHPSKVKPYLSIKEALKDSEWVILAIPAAYIAEALSGISEGLFKNKKIISGVKGMVPSSHQLVTDWLVDNLKIDKNNLGAIAGPCHAEEIAQEKQSFLTIASENMLLAQDFSKLLSNKYVKCSTIGDLIGVEYAAVMKNIVALACGITHGLGAGDNFQAVMVSNAMQEIKNLISAINPQQRDLTSSAYLGDLLVTAYSQFSRNRTFGSMIGRGYLVSAAQMEMKMVAEGYFATKSIFEINQKLNVNMPIVEFTHQILYLNGNLRDCFNKLIQKLN